MDATTAKTIADKFLTSAFGSLETLLGTPYSFSAGEPAEVAADKLAAWCQSHPVCMRSGIVGGGAAALMWRMEDAAGLVAHVSGGDLAAKTSLDDSDEAMVQELTDAVLGGGAAGLSELLGEDVQLQGATSAWHEDATTLVGALGGDLIAVEASFDANGQAGTVILLFSQALADRIAPGGADAAEEPIVSDDELQDILSGFTPDDEPDHAGGPVGPTGPMPENLSVIMDIELVATARLGKVEVPISQILNYGPGSIIEMRHLVDEPVELLVNGKLIARGDVVVVDEKFGLRITEIISPQERIESLR